MTETTAARPKTSGAGRTLIVFYFIMTIAALARSVVQILTEFAGGPLPILVSFVSGVVYLVATIALIRPGRRAYLTAVATIAFELVGVLVVGALSIALPAVFPAHYTVWWWFGAGYLLLPLILPVLGLLFLRSQRAVFAREA
jgi:hypothetical protein